MIDDITPLFTIISGPAAELLLQAYINLQRHESPLTVPFEVMPDACPGVSFSALLEIHDIRWFHVPVITEVRRRSPRALVAVPCYDLKAKMELPKAAITLLGGFSPIAVTGTYYPKGHDEPGFGWFNENKDV